MNGQVTTRALASTADAQDSIESQTFVCKPTTTSTPSPRSQSHLVGTTQAPPVGTTQTPPSPNRQHTSREAKNRTLSQPASRVPELASISTRIAKLASRISQPNNRHSFAPLAPPSIALVSTGAIEESTLITSEEGSRLASETGSEDEGFNEESNHAGSLERSSSPTSSAVLDLSLQSDSSRSTFSASEQSSSSSDNLTGVNHPDDCTKASVRFSVNLSVKPAVNIPASPSAPKAKLAPFLSSSPCLTKVTTFSCDDDDDDDDDLSDLDEKELREKRLLRAILTMSHCSIPPAPLEPSSSHVSASQSLAPPPSSCTPLISHTILRPNTALITGPNGSVRGKKNIVRKSINNYFELVKQANTEKGKLERDFVKEERNRCVLYVTTLGIIRKTFEESKQIKAILKNHFIEYEERDVYINEDFKAELRSRSNELWLKVPVLYLNGQCLGGFELIEKLNESGQLVRLLERYRKPPALFAASAGLRSADKQDQSSATHADVAHNSQTSVCVRCGGSKFVNCDKCNGSCRTYVRHYQTTSVMLKCSKCKKTGLVRCPEC